MKLKKLSTVLGISLSLALAGPAQAVSNFFFEDNDLDFVLRDDGTGNFVPITTGTLSVGDVLFATFEIDDLKINGVSSIPSGKELTGVAAVQITNITGSGIGATYDFGPFASLNAVLTANGGADALPAGAAVAMWLNDLSVDFDAVGASLSAISCNSLASCIPQVATGSLFQVDGFGLDADEFWQATQVTAGGGDINTVQATGSTISVAVFNAGLSNLFSASGPVKFIQIGTNAFCPGGNYAADGCVQIVLSGDVKGGAGLRDATHDEIVARSDFQAEKFVPEPATLALFGLGLLGLGARLRREA